MLCTGAQTIQYFVPTLVAQREPDHCCKRAPAEFLQSATRALTRNVSVLSILGVPLICPSTDHTIPLYACAFVFILVFCFASDRYQNKPVFISIAAFFGTLCFILTVAMTNQTGQCQSFPTYFRISTLIAHRCHPCFRFRCRVRPPSAYPVRLSLLR